ncbi:MAG TPA: DUF1405 domain-containing protein [Roseiflexaceae bacterium]|jgi:uncharacterized membrane protein YpjA|nr:DUF1405 domain-containing protein [Roseiflexaceae bacterium]
MIRLLTWIRRLIVGHAVLFWPAMIANLLGAVIGTAWWYGPQLLASPLWAYPFIPDCPLAAGVATVAFFGLRYGKRWPFFNALVAFGCMKYGVWTMAFWLKHWSGGGEIEPISLGLFVTHIGLFCEGALLATVALPLSLPKRLTVFLWYVLSIVVDYGLGFHPPLTEYVPVEYAFWVAAAMTFALGVGLLALPRWQPATTPATVAA